MSQFAALHLGAATRAVVEVANLIPTHASVAVRDSKLPYGPALTLPVEAFTAFVAHVRT
nr:DUF397 domain-containing protein [Streptomyces sp. NBC_00886]